MKKHVVLMGFVILVAMLMAGCSVSAPAQDASAAPESESIAAPGNNANDIVLTSDDTAPRGPGNGGPNGGPADGQPGQQPEGGQDTPSDQPAASAPTSASVAASPVVDTGVGRCYNDSQEVACPSEGQPFYGQDAQYISNAPAYVDNGDGTVTDQNTGLMWAQDPGDKVSYAQAVANAESYTLAGYDDWRLPTIDELYSLIDFNGTDPSRLDSSAGVAGLTPFLDADTFVFTYGDVTGGRVIDSQWVTSTLYVSAVMGGEQCFFGVNFADGRIKCYPTTDRGNGYYALYVRGVSYGVNALVDNGDGTISDTGTALMWAQDDNGDGIVWEDALGYCEALNLAGYDDWRLPDIKELQSIVDYTRSPDTTNSPALSPLFNATGITNELGQPDYGYYWSSTTHRSYGETGGGYAAYIAFGRGLGYMNGQYVDVHGAGSQRTDPKNYTGEPYTQGPQGDVRRGLNFARCVRSGDASESGVVGEDGAAPGTTVADQPPGDGTSNQPSYGTANDSLPGGGQQGPGNNNGGQPPQPDGTRPAPPEGGPPPSQP